jgi:TonB family protein
VPLYLPPDVLTQREPNKQKISKSIDLADLRPTPTAPPREARPAPSRKHFEMPRKPAPQQTAKAATQILPEAPKVAVNQATGPLPPGAASGLPRAATPAPPEPGPFQNVGSETPLNPNPTLIPKTSVQAAIQALAPVPKGAHMAISDDSSSEASPRIPGSIGQPASPHAAVELQSDPQGADFKPYLTRILAIVRANWRRVVPESARSGALRGRTVMEFIINRDGSIPKIVTADSSGSDALDRAALAGLSMSNPLPPLPADYKGFQVRLAFTFSYNLPTQ